MVSTMTASTKARILFNFIILVLPIAACNTLKAVLRAWLQRLPIGLAVKNAFGRAAMGHTPTRDIQAILPSTIDTYRQWAASVGFRPEIETLSDNATRLMWIGSTKSDKVILFLHGKSPSLS